MKKKNKKQNLIKTKFYLLFFIITALFPGFSCSENLSREEYSRVEFVLGTVCQIRLLTTLPKERVDEVFDASFEELVKLDAIFNANTEHSDYGIGELDRTEISELELVNQKAGKESVPVSKELFELLSIALDIAKKTDGAFNPAIGALVKCWDIGFSGKSVPPKEEISSALAISNFRDIELKENKSSSAKIEYRVFLKKEGMRLDLGAVAKGYAADQLSSIIRRAGIEDALIDIGGNVLALGKNAKGRNWGIGLKNPNIGEQDIAGVLHVSGQSVVTSGNYERYFEESGKIYHHILDCKTGYPVETSLNAVSVISDKSLYADLLSTTCFVLGEEKSRNLISELRKKTDSEISILFFYNDNSVRLISEDKLSLEIKSPFVF